MTPSRYFFLWTIPLFVVAASSLITACGEDSVTDPDAPAKLVSTYPVIGGMVFTGHSVQLVFDKDPGTLTITGGAGGGSGTIRTVVPWASRVLLSWDNGGTAALDFIIIPNGGEGATLSSADPFDGATNTDPTRVNTNGIILVFDKTINTTKNLDVTESGTKLGWITTTSNMTVTLKPPRGKELVNGKEYVVSGEVEDLAGNRTDVSVMFTTIAKQ